jgi:ATP-dependent DNA helicase DinG
MGPLPDSPDQAVDALLDRLADAMGPSGEHRPGQHEMARAVGSAIRRRRHLVVQAGTGTGKSLAYLAPPLALERTVVVATATKALQDQLAGKELPFLSRHLDRDVSWAVLKGRSNYLCLQRLDEVSGGADGQLGLDGVAVPSVAPGQVAMLREWAETTRTGDRADLEVEPSERTWAAVSVGPRECPGAKNCPRGEDCFAELARRRAASADVVIVNTHLYGLHLASDGMILPPHQVAVFDEAHEVADIISATTGLELGGGRFTAAGRIAGGLIAEEGLVDGLDRVASQLTAALASHVGSRLRRGMPTEVADVLALGRQRLGSVLETVGKVDATASADVATRIQRVRTAVGALVDDIDRVTDPVDGSVLWVSGDAEHPRLSLAPLDVGATLDELLWNAESTGLEIVTDRDQSPDGDDGPRHPETVVFTSATVPATLAVDLRVPADRVDTLDVGTPFDFEHQALLYCPASMPDPRQPTYAAAVFDELARLIDAAGGRTLALFTSHKMMRDAADELAGRIDHTILRQGELPKPRLVARFAEEHSSCLFATMGYWQGIDVPGPSLSLVTIDKIPFPRPDDPLLQARREAVGAAAFRVIDLPRAATLLAQGVGRLIRHREDRGVVAVLDPRLATARAYRWDLLAALPPMRRTKDFDDVAAFLRP